MVTTGFHSFHASAAHWASQELQKPKMQGCLAQVIRVAPEVQLPWPIHTHLLGLITK